MRFLVTGGRSWCGYTPIYRVLKRLYEVDPDAILVHGDCKGADKIAAQIAREMFGRTEAQIEAHPADWTKYKLAAGPIRNQFMLNESLRRGYVDGHWLKAAAAFHTHLPSSKGTKHMVKLLEDADVPVLRISSNL